MLRCKACGNITRFLGGQRVQGTISIVVDGNGEFVGNPTESGEMDTSGLIYGDAEGPYVCEKCNSDEIETFDPPTDERREFVLKMALIYLRANLEDAAEAFYPDADESSEEGKVFVEVNGERQILPKADEIDVLSKLL